jgi:hypothetical protein
VRVSSRPVSPLAANLLAALLPFFVMACGGGSDAAETPTTTAPAAAVAASPTVAPESTPPPATATPLPPTATPEPTPIVVAGLPIIDLHFHPDPGWDAYLPGLFDDLGVALAGNGGAAPDARILELAQRHPGRLVAFAGGQHVRQLINQHGSSAWQLQNPETEAYLQELEAALQAGQFHGIGEIHVNNWGSNLPSAPQYVFPADSPLMQRLFAFSAAYGVLLSVHMDAEPESVASMERLLESNRDGVWLWAHTGHYAEPELLRRLLETHPNLYCELSYRSSISGGRLAIPLDEGGVLRDSWRQLLEDFPDRFVIGTDLTWPSAELYATHIRFWRGILEQLTPEAAARLAHLNAQALLNLR